MAIILLPSLLFTYEFAVDIYNEIIQFDSFSLRTFIRFSIYLFICVTLGFISFLAIKRWVNKSPGLIINKEGIIDNSGLMPSGIILWSEMEGISSDKIIFSDCISIKVKDTQKFILRQKNLFTRRC